MQLQLVKNDKELLDNSLQPILAISRAKLAYANISDADYSIALQNDRKLFIFGKLFYHIQNSGKIRLIDESSGKYLRSVFSNSELNNIIQTLEGQYIGLLTDASKRSVQIFSDRYARLDTFYSIGKDDCFFFSTDMDSIFKNIEPQYDQRMIAHLFAVYGWYVPKGHTIYNNVRQLKVGEILTLSNTGIRSKMLRFSPLNVEEYNEKNLETYYEVLTESVISRANKSGKTWVSSSSGWDSSMLLGLLVNEFGSKNVGMLTGSMKYSSGTDVINKFEVDKIKEIGKFYGIKPEIVNFDYMSSKAADYFEKILPYYKSKHVYTYATLNFSRLSDQLSKISGSGQIIFNGETSDSFHNFGFSQFATFFHSQKIFTEYSDKMNCYLFGPSFLKKVLGNTYEKDKVYQIFKNMHEPIEFRSDLINKKDKLEGYLFPLFYGSPRVPFAMTYSNDVFTRKGIDELYRFPFRDYMPDILNSLSPDNIYSWIIYLYQSFHSQGSTVNIQKYSMERNGHSWRSPFNDCRVIDILSKAPESWGRGLDFNSTKFPLKWSAKNKIRFPYDLLQNGPHSYLYDVIEGFSLYAEITYRSGVTAYFKEALSHRPYRQIIDDEFFDLSYLQRLTNDYLNDKEVYGQDFNNLVSLITLSVTGWY